MQPVDKRVWYSSGEKIVSMNPCEGYEEAVFSSVTEWFWFIQILVQERYRIT